MSNRYYSGPSSDHFDGERFFHPGLPASDKTLLDVLRWRFKGERSKWPASVPGRATVRPPETVDGLEITLVGHSSLLIQVAGTNLLVDPVWSERASPLRWAGPRRHNAPAIRLEELPRIDAVLLSHNHYDHLDNTTLARLWRDHRAHMITPLGNEVIVRAATPQAEVESGDWWDSFALANGMRVTIVPSYHWSSRGLGDRRMALWGGFMLETPLGLIYCAGDTAYRDGAIFREIGKRFEAPIVAVLPIGAYAPRWFMQTQHADPEEALQIAMDVGTKQVLGVHWGTFPLTDEPYDEPEKRLAEAVRAHSSKGLKAMAMHAGDTWRLGG